MSRPRLSLSQVSPRTLKDHPGRYRARQNEPKTVGVLGNPSRWLSAECKAIWRALVSRSPSKLGANDRCLMEITCTLKAKLEEGAITGPQTSQLLACLSKLGFIPLSREAIPAPKAKEEDEWEAL
jgi:hypothetical protein